MEPRPVRAWLVLGANLGNAARSVRSALRALNGLPHTRLLRHSSLLLTSPVGRTRQPDFVNCGALIRTRLSPMGLLTELKRLEALAGRRPGPRWGPRPLDIDIAAYGGRRLRSPLLTLPHPRLLERRFALAALAELSPGMRLPGTSRTLGALSAAFRDSSQNVRVLSSRRRDDAHG